MSKKDAGLLATINLLKLLVRQDKTHPAIPDLLSKLSFDGEAQEVLRGLAQDSSGIVRQHAVRCMDALLDLPDALSIITELASDPLWYVRKEVAHQIPGGGKLKPVVQQLEHDENESVRWTAQARPFTHLGLLDKCDLSGYQALLELGVKDDEIRNTRSLKELCYRLCGIQASMNERSFDFLKQVLDAGGSPVVTDRIALFASAMKSPLLSDTPHYDDHLLMAINMIGGAGHAARALSSTEPRDQLAIKEITGDEFAFLLCDERSIDITQVMSSALAQEGGRGMVERAWAEWKEKDLPIRKGADFIIDHIEHSLQLNAIRVEIKAAGEVEYQGATRKVLWTDPGAAFVMLDDEQGGTMDVPLTEFLQKPTQDMSSVLEPMIYEY
ncbi:MAG: HEAT repeat domain-containing protein [Marinospirillum sp.]|uniref:HEAT repeat domain-containing protein n=1 Tax=Marinospirillum sp. TaxID=2183934 RepID=UPI001A0A2646|nr:HEAT repeat domain-containing protein [Marinospirillum sp.]MBE0507264.1 HEAT repeat domain-containing protein [Marinospirillum sp.]